jgi:DNA (cytosine-5)-methyltransferase 1
MTSLFGDLRRPLNVDLFCGGGGASLGMSMAGWPVDVALNHSPAAIAMHSANHPEAIHFEADVFDLAPGLVARGRPVDVLWGSPACPHHSRARGGVPRSEQSRSQANIVVQYVRELRPMGLHPRLICVENVPEFLTWGRLTPEGQPDPLDRGNLFRQWVGALEAEGYAVEWRVLKACDFGVPTRRERVYIVARRDGAPCWPSPTHGPGLQPYASAASCIDWSIPCPSIFLSPEEARAQGCRRPLRPATLARIAEGVRRFVLEAQRPFLVQLTHGGRVRSVDQPMDTITAANRGETALVQPFLISTANGEREGQSPRVRDIEQPMQTATATGSPGGLVAAFLAQHFGGGPNGELSRGLDLVGPMGSPTASGQVGPVAVFLDKLHGSARAGCSVEAPMPTAAAGGGRGGGHAALVAAFLMHYYTGGGQGQAIDQPLHTSTTKARTGLVTVSIGGTPYVLVDVGMRMLAPRELARGMGFPDEYKLPVNKALAIKGIGNAVCPEMARLLVLANAPAVGRMAA